MKEVNPNMYPAGGRFFIESDGTKIKGTSWVAVEKAVERYRQNRKVPVGAVHAEVMAQACERNPGLCRDYSEERQKPAPTLKARVFAWLAEKSRQARTTALDFVSDSEAKRRAAICRQCPKQKKISHLCTACSESRKALRDSVLDGRKSVAGNVEACEVLALDLQSAVHLSEPPDTLPELPENCWRRTV